MVERFPEYANQALIPLKAMLSHARPDNLKKAADHWSTTSSDLRAAADDLQQAVEHAVANWEGDAANGFVAKAGQIQQSLQNTADHALNTSYAMETASSALQEAKAH